MPQTIRQRRALRRAIDLSRFQPIAPLARDRVDELTRRGAVIVRVSAEQITLRRQAKLATVDQFGRVRWS